MEALKNMMLENLVPLVGSAVGGGLIALIFGSLRAGLSKLRLAAKKTETTVDDTVVDVVDQGAALAEQDAKSRLNVVFKSKK